MVDPEAWNLPTVLMAAAVAVIYALVVETAVYRSFGLKAMMEIAESSAITVVVIFILLAVGSLLSFFITLAQVPAGTSKNSVESRSAEHFSQWLICSVGTKWRFG